MAAEAMRTTRRAERTERGFGAGVTPCDIEEGSIW
jgi:hypothetical protein